MNYELGGVLQHTIALDRRAAACVAAVPGPRGRAAAVSMALPALRRCDVLRVRDPPTAEREQLP